MSTDHQILMVRSTKGSLAQIVLAFLFARAALDLDEVRTWTGLNQETARDGLKQLKGMGLIGKQIAAHGRVLWIPGADLLPGFTQPKLETAKFQVAEIPRSGPTTTTTTIDLSNRLIDSVVVVDTQVAEIPRPGTPSTLYLTHGVTFGKNLAMCQSVMIGEPKASQISLLEHVSPELIKAHVGDLRDGERLGLAIIRIQNNEMPRSWLEEIKGIPRPQHDDAESEEE